MGKKTVPAKKSTTPKPAPTPAPAVEVPEVAPLMPVPLATTSAMVPSYSMVAPAPPPTQHQPPLPMQHQPMQQHQPTQHPSALPPTPPAAWWCEQQVPTELTTSLVWFEVLTHTTELSVFVLYQWQAMCPSLLQSLPG